MRRTLASALVVSAFCCFGLVGCGDESGTKVKETVTTPEGKTTTEVDKKVTSEGSNPPTNSAGETGKTPK